METKAPIDPSANVALANRKRHAETDSVDSPPSKKYCLPETILSKFAAANEKFAPDEACAHRKPANANEIGVFTKQLINLADQICSMKDLKTGGDETTAKIVAHAQAVHTKWTPIAALISTLSPHHLVELPSSSRYVNNAVNINVGIYSVGDGVYNVESNGLAYHLKIKIVFELTTSRTRGKVKSFGVDDVCGTGNQISNIIVALRNLMKFEADTNASIEKLAKTNSSSFSALSVASLAVKEPKTVAMDKYICTWNTLGRIFNNVFFVNYASTKEAKEGDVIVAKQGEIAVVFEQGKYRVSCVNNNSTALFKRVGGRLWLEAFVGSLIDANVMVYGLSTVFKSTCYANQVTY